MGIQAISSSTAADPTLLAQAQAAGANAPASGAAQAQKAGGARPAGGPPPAGGAGGAKPAASSGSAGGSSSATKVYDKRDSNKDGMVSFMEDLQYSLQHPVDESETEENVTSSQLQTGLSAYQQDQHPSPAPLSSTIFAV
jgi:hypothetical protein